VSDVSAMRLPDFIIGGAPRSGTTWLYEALDRHPELHLAQPVVPEPKFFLVDSEYDKGLMYYSKRWFDGIPAGVLAGEKSTNYLESPAARTRIAHDLPSVKLLFILRDPADRACDNYRWSRMNGLEPLDLDEALRCEAERELAYDEKTRYSRPFSYFSRGLYAELLRPWFESVARDQIAVVRFEDIIERPSDLLSEAHRFLDVAMRPFDHEGLGKINAAEGPTCEEAALVRLRSRYKGPNRDLEELLGRKMWGEL